MLAYKLLSKCEERLIADHKDILIADFQNLLDYDKDEGADGIVLSHGTFLRSYIFIDLQRMYSLLSRIQDGLEPLRSKFEEHVKASGLNAVSKMIPEGGVDALVRSIPTLLHIGS